MLTAITIALALAGSLPATPPCSCSEFPAGVVVDPRNRDAMDEIGTRVYLHVGVDELVSRLGSTVQAEVSARPLLLEEGLEEGKAGPARVRSRITELLDARRSAYRGARIVVDAESDPSSVANRIVVALGGVAEFRDSEAV